MSAPSQPSPDWRVVGLATAAAAVVRLVGLGRHSLWLDELYTATLSQGGPHHIVKGLAVDVHPPGYYLLIWAWGALAGSSEVALRLPSAVAGVVCVPLLAALSARLYGPRSAEVAAWLLALAPYAVLMSQEARSNMLLATLATAASLALLRRDALAYGLLCAALVWTHVFGLFVLLAHALFGLATGPRSWPREVVLAGLAGGLSLLPWVGVLAGQTARFAQDGWYTPPTGDALRWLVEALCVDASGLVYLVLGGWLLALARRTDRDGPLLFAAFAVALVFVPLLVSVTVAPILRARSVLPLLPLLLAGAAAGIASLEPAPVRRAAVGLAALVSLGVCVEAVFQAPAREQWREVAQLVQQEQEADEAIVSNDPVLWEHYLGRRPRPLADSDDRAALQRSLWGTGRGWLLVGHQQRPEIFAQLAEIAEVHREEEWLGIHWARYTYPLWAVPLDDFAVPEDQMKVDGALHFYWNSAATAPLLPLTVAQTCTVRIDAGGDRAGGTDPAVAAEVSGPDGVLAAYTIDISRGRDHYETAPLTLPAGDGVRLILRFLNDGAELDASGTATADRNAYIHGVWLRC